MEGSKEGRKGRKTKRTHHQCPTDIPVNLNY